LFIPLDEHATAVMFCIALHVLVHTAWLRPARILVLRPFNATDQRYGLMKLMRQLCFLGHIYTLEDTVFRGNSGCLPGGGSWAWGWPRLLLTFRLSITTEHGVWKLQRAIGHRFRRNLNWILARHKVFAVNVSNEWWQRCVQVLVNACDAIVIDVSTSRAGVMWELSEIAHYELSERCVFISNSRDLAAVQELARTTDPSGECPTLLYERVSGGTDNKALSFAVAKCIAATRSSSHARFDQVLEREIR
jgi:hypothetical protein